MTGRSYLKCHRYIIDVYNYVISVNGGWNVFTWVAIGGVRDDQGCLAYSSIANKDTLDLAVTMKELIMAPCSVQSPLTLDVSITLTWFWERVQLDWFHLAVARATSGWPRSRFCVPT